MRIRTLKPEWLDDERIVLAGSDARVLSVALILLADDYGNGRANPMVVGSRVFPNKPGSYVDALRKLVDIGFVQLYTDHEQEYYHVRNWDTHQKISKPGKPHVPAPTPINIDPQESPKKIRGNNNSPELPEIPPPGSKDLRTYGSKEGDRACTREDTPPEVLDWKTVPITWQGVHMCLQDLTGFMGDAHYHKRHLQSVADSCNAQADPVAALTKVVKCKQKEVDKNGKRLQPLWLATDFDRLLNTEVKLEKDEEYIRLQRIYFGAEDEWKLQKSIGTKKSVARAEQQYQEAMKEYHEYKELQ